MISTLAEYHFETEKKFKDRRKDSILTPPYYRGHADKSFSLTSTLLRFCGQDRNNFSKENYIEIQKDLIVIFEEELKKANLLNVYYDFILEGKKSIWHVLSQMQHVGLPTNLIDFTYDKNIALFFALDDEKNDYINSPACVWIYFSDFGSPTINPSNIAYYNPYEVQDSRILNMSKSLDAVGKSNGQNTIIQQKGRFLSVSFNNLDKPLDSIGFKNCFEKILIPAGSKQKLMNELSLIGITKDLVYSSNKVEEIETVIDLVKEKIRHKYKLSI